MTSLVIVFFLSMKTNNCDEGTDNLITVFGLVLSITPFILEFNIESKNCYRLGNTWNKLNKLWKENFRIKKIENSKIESMMFWIFITFI
jgi:hypothetical protein